VDGRGRFLARVPWFRPEQRRLPRFRIQPDIHRSGLRDPTEPGRAQWDAPHPIEIPVASGIGVPSSTTSKEQDFPDTEPRLFHFFLDDPTSESANFLDILGAHNAPPMRGFTTVCGRGCRSTVALSSRHTRTDHAGWSPGKRIEWRIPVQYRAPVQRSRSLFCVKCDDPQPRHAGVFRGGIGVEVGDNEPLSSSS